MRRFSDLAAGASSCWRIDRKGSFALWDAAGGDVTLRSRKAQALVAFLSSHPDKRIGREHIMELLWADRGEAQARGSLRQILFEIRRAAPGLVEGDNHHVWIESDALFVEAGDASSPDPGLFADLDGITPEFDDWLRAERATEVKEKWSTLHRKVNEMLGHDEGNAALPLVDAMRRLDPYNEDWLRLAMRAEAQAGHPAGIQQCYAQFSANLKRELGVGPARETRELRDQLLAKLTFEPGPEESSPIQPDPGVGAIAAPKLGRQKRPWVMVAGTVAMLATLGLSQSTITPAVSAVPTIAVLPFQPVGIEPALAEGFSDELLTQLVRNPGLRVIGRTAFADVSSTPEGLRTFRRDLGVEYIVEGRVAPTQNRLRVLVSLVRTKDAKTMWAENFVGTSDRLQSIQAAIGSAVGLSLSANAPPFARKTTSGDAYALYLRAKGLIRDRSRDGYKSAAELLGAALRIDPKFAAAWAQLAANTRLAESPNFLDPTNPGAMLTPVQGAQRALDLDSNLAEAHAILAMTVGVESANARAHLSKALALEPRDPQALYWAGLASATTGNFRLSNQYYRQSAALDPLWKRPVQVAAIAAMYDGDRAAAERYVRTIKAGNPEAALEVEIAYKFAEGDFSEAAVVAVQDWVSRQSWDEGKNIANAALLDLGLASTPFGPRTPFDRAIASGKVPDRATLLSEARHWSADGTGDVFNYIFLWSLARERRWGDIAALYVQGTGAMGRLTNGDPGGRLARLRFGGIIALALKKAGRDSEAVKVALAMDEAVKFTLVNGDVPANDLASIAQDEAVLGHSNAAIAHLAQAYSMGWRMFLDTNRYMDPAEDPTLATLRGNTEFERINRLIKAHKAKERQEYLAFMRRPSWMPR